MKISTYIDRKMIFENFHISINIRCHISVNIRQFWYWPIYVYIFRQNICFYISVVIRPYIYRANISPKLKSWNITYMDRYMPLVGIYWSIYVILKWFKRSGLILTDICNGLITPDIWKHIWAEYVSLYRAILMYIDRCMKIVDKFRSIYVVPFPSINFHI